MLVSTSPSGCTVPLLPTGSSEGKQLHGVTAAECLHGKERTWSKDSTGREPFRWLPLSFSSAIVCTAQDCPSTS